ISCLLAPTLTTHRSTLSLHDALPISLVFNDSASSAVLPLINSVARLATAMAVSQPNDWKVALSITFLPFSSLYLIQRRSISPHRSEEHTSELQSRVDLVCRLLLEIKK